MYGTFRCAALTAVLIAVSSSSEAKVVTGELNITGTVAFSSTLVDFTPGPLGTGSAPIVGGSGGTFTTLVGSLAIVRDIPIPSAGGILNAITFQAEPLLRFDTAAVEPGIFGASQCAVASAVGQSCTVPGTPFNLTNTRQGSTLSFEVNGIFIDLSDGTANPTPYQGIATAQFIGKSYQQVLASIADGQNITTSYSASFGPSVVPEASNVLMLSAGLLALGALGWRRSRHE